MASGFPWYADPLLLQVYKGNRWNQHETWGNRGHRAPADWTYGKPNVTVASSGKQGIVPEKTVENKLRILW